MGEAEVLGPAGFATRLLAGRRPEAALELRRVPTPGGAERVRWLARALTRDGLGWLTRAGGWRSRQVVTGGRRREGRWWSPGVAEALGLRFTEAPLRLLVATMEEVDPGALPQVDPELAAAVEASLGGPNPASGDLLALHLLVERLLAGRAPLPVLGAAPDGLTRELLALNERLDGCRGAAVLARDGAVLACTLPDPAAAGLPAGAAALLRREAGSAGFGWGDYGAARGGRVVGRPLGDARLLLLIWLELPGGGRLVLDAKPFQAGAERVQASALACWDREALEEEGRTRALLRLSPLSLACHPEANGALDGVLADEALARARLAPLFQGDRPALLSYLDEALARAWLAEERRRRGLAPAQAEAAWRAGARGLRAYAAACKERPDALRPLLLFLRQLLRVWGQREPQLTALRGRAQELDRASERDRFLATVAELFALGREVTRRAERALAQPFVDRSEAEKAFLADYQTTLKDLAPELEAIRRELAAELG